MSATRTRRKLGLRATFQIAHESLGSSFSVFEIFVAIALPYGRYVGKMYEETAK